MPSRESIAGDSAFLLVRRLSGLNYFPKDDEAVAMLIKAMQSAPSMEAAEAFVAGWIKSEHDCPKPVDIYDHFNPRPGEYLGAPQNTGCPLCGGSGWRIVEKNGIEGAKRCKCIATASAA